eukprot:scpid28929/ scgid9763/ 
MHTEKSRRSSRGWPVLLKMSTKGLLPSESRPLRSGCNVAPTRRSLLVQHRKKTQIKKYEDGLEEAAKGLCKEQCSHGCHFLCLYPKKHGDREHDCFTHRDKHNPTGKHTCLKDCDLCGEYCDLQPGHEHDATNNDPRHLCANRMTIHLCGQSQGGCIYQGARNCLQECHLFKGHLGKCWCSTDKDEHLCATPCQFHEQPQCEKLCIKKFQHHGGHHLCGCEHECIEPCTSTGACCKQAEQPDGGMRYLETVDGWRRKCKKKIPAGIAQHKGDEHTCGLDDSDHLCGKSCPWCLQCCDTKKSSWHDICSTGHGTVHQDHAGEYRIKLLRSEQSAIVSTLVESQTSIRCSDVCKKAGDRHRHISNGSVVLHSEFWKYLQVEDPCTEEDGITSKFHLCRAQCEVCQESYCEEEEVTQVHQDCDRHPSSELRRKPPSMNNGIFEYISTNKCKKPGHRFKCQKRHSCIDKCRHPVSRSNYSVVQALATKLSIGTTPCGQNCSLDLGHDIVEGSSCKCGGRHACGKPCKGNNNCQETCCEDEDKEHDDHDCGKKECKVPCGVKRCSRTNCGNTNPGKRCRAAAPNRNRCTMVHCGKPCKAEEHFHKSSSEIPHNCGNHKCRRPCTGAGRCPNGTPGSCRLPITKPLADVPHDGNCDMSCDGEHKCDVDCTGCRKYVCDKPFGHGGNERHDCGEKRCRHKCVVKQCDNCGAIKTKQDPAPWCREKSGQYCTMQQCHKDCASTDHFHKLSDGEYHY